ncbi:MAG TPA: hypothetical protein VLC07_00245 [Solirubrobacterales bacterium]|nr:hypothetical protein [Solirubrobacterales bacterium]
MVAAYCAKPGNGMGGNLHIALADQNVRDKDIAWCRERALQEGDDDGVALADQLLRMTKTQRLRVCHSSP